MELEHIGIFQQQRLQVIQCLNVIQMEIIKEVIHFQIQQLQEYSSFIVILVNKMVQVQEI